MAAANLPLSIEQGGTYVFQIKIEKDGQSQDLTDIKFVGTVKNSIYDDQGYPFRFDKVDIYTVNVYLDADVTESMGFTKGVYEIKSINSGGFNSPLLKGPVANILGASDETSYN